jgi:hypothetical protein
LGLTNPVGHARNGPVTTPATQAPAADAMKTIYKYKLKLAEVVEVEMPTDARVLTAQTQGVHVWIWAIIDTDPRDKEKRRFAVLKTGQQIGLNTDVLTHVGSVQFDEGGLVYHVFEYPMD